MPPKKTLFNSKEQGEEEKKLDQQITNNNKLQPVDDSKKPISGQQNPDKRTRFGSPDYSSQSSASSSGGSGDGRKIKKTVREDAVLKKHYQHLKYKFYVSFDRANVYNVPSLITYIQSAIDRRMKSDVTYFDQLSSMNTENIEIEDWET